MRCGHPLVLACQNDGVCAVKPAPTLSARPQLTCARCSTIKDASSYGSRSYGSSTVSQRRRVSRLFVILLHQHMLPLGALLAFEVDVLLQDGDDMGGPLRDLADRAPYLSIDSVQGG